MLKLQEKEWMLGKIVYSKVKRHMQSEGGSKDFIKRVASEETIDDALIHFLKAKIKKARVELGRGRIK